MTKRLILIPIIHPQNESILKAIKFGIAENADDINALREVTNIFKTEKFWDELEERLFNRLKNENYTKIKVYQDAMDETPTHEQFINNSKISRNWHLIHNLHLRGTVIMKTENRRLLDITERILISGDDTELALITHQRDEFIAKTIEKTLKNGELGILFIGIAHNVHKHFSPHIIIEWIMFTEKELNEYKYQIEKIKKIWEKNDDQI